MGGRGRPPKPAHLRARRNKDPFPTRVIEANPVPQPALPDAMPGGEPWPEITLEWWRRWSRDPLAAGFRASDWSELMDTAAIHGAFWSGEIKLAGELRLRTAKFGATAEDRARLRIQYAAADEADEKREHARYGASGRYVGLRAVDPAD